jgi:DNA-binding transcriptional MerR regulator
MKYLGFSLDDIKNRLVSLETPEQVTDAQKEQANKTRERIASLTEVLSNVEALAVETEQMKTVDWHKYADIVAVLQAGYKEYWAIKYFDGKILDRVRNINKESGEALVATWRHSTEQAIQFKNEGVSPGSPQGRSLAKAFWDFITEFTGGDMSLLPEMMKFEETADGWDGEWKTAWENAKDFLEPALGSYFQTIGYNPFEGVENNDSNE